MPLDASPISVTGWTRIRGSIRLLTGRLARPHVLGATAIAAAFGSIDNLTQNLAFEVSRSGVRGVSRTDHFRQQVHSGHVLQGENDYNMWNMVLVPF